MVRRTGVMTIEDFIRLYDTEGPFELVNGERVPVSLDVAGQAVTLNSVFAALNTYCEAHRLGEVFLKCPFVMTDDREWLFASRAPHLIFYEAARWVRYLSETEDWADKPFMLIPDLVVRVASPTDQDSDIQMKGERYLADGVRLAWLIDPWRRNVTIYRSGGSQVLSDAGTLTGGDVLSGFSLPLPDLFA